MLNFNKIIFLALFLSSILFNQSLLNGYGFGKKIDIYDASSLGISSTGLLPSFKKDVSLQNPSTWKNLDFTYFSGTYQVEQKIILDNYFNSTSDLGYAQFIVPIKNKYAFGLGIHPYFNQYIILSGIDENDQIAFGDTLTTQHSYSSYGGITAFNVSFAGNVSTNLNASIAFDFLYGSARQQTIFSLDDLNYYSKQRHIYTGSLAKLYFNSDILSIWNIPLNLYFGWGFPVQSISVKSYLNKPFEDSNDSGVQDNFDFPKLSDSTDPVVLNTKNASAPYEYQIGFDYNIQKGINILGEYSRWEDKENIGAKISALNDQIQSIDHLNIGIIRFKPRIAKNLLDRLNYKIGAYSNTIKLLNSEKIIKEYGVSTGLSFNFGVTKNQIDFAYSIGKREGLFEIGDENIQKFSIGITVGDIWFVKRRAQ
ncbi:MAG: hypothetical protein V3S42_04405 [Candidatus Neomarinimicrobiota bacterium]